MSRSAKILIIIIVSILLVGFVIYWFSKDYFLKHNWNESYRYNSKEPYGLKILYDVCLQKMPKGKFVRIEASPIQVFERRDTGAFYIQAHKYWYIDSITLVKLLNFVRKGNTAFVSSDVAYHAIIRSLICNDSVYIREDTHVNEFVRVVVHTGGKDLSYFFDYKKNGKLSKYHWSGIDESFLVDTLKIGAGKISSIKPQFVDCFYIPVGKGKIIIHLNPILLTNYNLSKEQGLNYLNSIFKNQQVNKIYWDENTNSGGGTGMPNVESPLRYILSNQSLRWAWYLLCTFVLIFLIFNSKRKQSAIQLIPENKNTTIEYIGAIAALHYQHKSYETLAEEIMKQFLAFIKHKYGISPGMDKNDIIRQLPLRSGIPEETIRNIFKHYLDVKYLPEVNDVLELYRLTEYFYKNCK